MSHYGVSMQEVNEWTIPHELEFHKVAVKSINRTRLVNMSDIATAFAATQNKEGNKAFQKLAQELQREING